jgi:hypothetical protein
MKVSGSNSVQIHAAADRCYAALLDFSSYPAWFPGVRTAESVAAPDGAPTVRLVFSAGVAALPDVECVLRYEVEPGRRCTPTVVGGDLRVEGPGWLLVAQSADLTEVTYEVTVEMDVPAASSPNGRSVGRRGAIWSSSPPSGCATTSRAAPSPRAPAPAPRAPGPAPSPRRRPARPPPG